MRGELTRAPKDNNRTLQKSALRARPRASALRADLRRCIAGLLVPYPISPTHWTRSLSRFQPLESIYCMYVCMYVCIARKLFTAFSVGSNQMCCNNYYVHSFGFISARTKVYLFFGNKYSGFAIVKFITKTPICTDCRVHFSWELLRP